MSPDWPGVLRSQRQRTGLRRDQRGAGTILLPRQQTRSQDSQVSAQLCVKRAQMFVLLQTYCNIE